MRSVFYYILIGLLFGCSPNSSNQESQGSDLDDKVSKIKSAINSSVEEPSKFGLAEDIIQKINTEMGLGSLLKWQNDAGPGEAPYWFTTLEYEVEEPNRSFENLNNVIELSIESKGATGKYVDKIMIHVLFMNPQDKVRAKKMFLQKVDLLSKVCPIQIPIEVQEAIKNETNTTFTIGNFHYIIEESGAKRRALYLTIK